ncbi:MAG: 3-dehydroquinate synthase [Chitinophagaceae bacterium]|nr:MAG: 3-dehydroquinate synthase [Chitinophagaceae bacterium]
MRKHTARFSSKQVDYWFDASFSIMETVFPKDRVVIITDENIFEQHFKKFEGYRTIVLAPGEAYKQQGTVDGIINRLLEWQADKQTVIVGVGGGVITDMVGYSASIYKRGVKLIQVPTSILAMVDAAVGGKNGVDVGEYKNQVGTIYQPEIVLFDYDFLSTLPEEEWVNGFAEIIKHACIKDAAQFALLQENTLADFQQDRTLLASLLEKNVSIKLNVVLNDEFETGDRKLLNFGHTIGHAIESTYNLSHGHAISIGMVMAAKISQQLAGLSGDECEAITNLLSQYKLPVRFNLHPEKIWGILMNDKKREGASMSFILLDKIGNGIVRPIPLTELKSMISSF